MMRTMNVADELLATSLTEALNKGNIETLSNRYIKEFYVLASNQNLHPSSSHDILETTNIPPKQ